MHRKILPLILVFVMFLQACGGLIAGFRVGFSVGKPVVDDLVVQHVLTQAQADVIKADVQDGINAASKAETSLAAIPANLTKQEKTIRKAQVYFALAQDLRAILNRHHIGGNPRLDQIAAIANDVITALEEYYRQVVTIPDAAVRGEAMPAKAGTPVDPEKDLKAKIDAAAKQLKALKAR